MRKLFGAAVVASAVALSLGAAADAKTFRYATTGDVLGLDPHINNEGPTNTMKNNVYEGLIHRAWDLSLHPGLATEWEQVNPTTWRFKLRQGVKYHNGNAFNADDVLFSFDRIRQPQSEMSFAVNTIKEIKKISDYEIEIITGGPDPILMLNLPNFHIMDKEWAEKNNTTDVERGSSAKTYANLNMNGTGPFKLIEWVPDTRVVLEPNKEWWGKPTHNLTKAIFTPIGNDATRVAALLSGEIDLMYPVPLQDVQRIDNSSTAKALQGPELRTIFLGFDQHRDEMLDMPGTGKNPFKDKKVRQAFYQAIDIEAIKRVVMRSAATPTGLMIAPGINGFDKALNDRYPYDPEASKKLLAEAGYPKGFPVTLDCPNDRYVNDEAICLAVVPMLKRIGIDIKLNAQTKSLHFDKIGAKTNYNTSFYMLGWTPGSYDALNLLENIITLDGKGQGTWNSGRYTNPRVEELTDLIRVETNQQKRNAMISEAMKIHKEDFGHLPLHQQALAWGVANTVAEVKQRPQNDVDLRYVTMK
ncbi:ABC transporter substrate-binding protein [Oceanibaculum nanhaiense]|jgi:peptide/nickel transport system substrate-binding protein|uniref:ABC transporter substrate-binding protein n=1 Tax=Oceanibaculum nanhaiense TaxID=1909734 RepID=UPI000A39A0D3|nr:ABC transporter substrate-binding protein [Oceanibaculum nanhaiense]